MKLSKFKFNLPSELIALHPAKNRDESRLMVVHRDTGEIEHREFKDILDYCLSLITRKFSPLACTVTRRKQGRVSRCSCCAS